MLIVIDPTARETDGESVRIARDVLSAGASEVKVCVLDGPWAMSRALARRGGRRVVVVGDDRALLSAVRELHRNGELGKSPLGMVPVGPATAVPVSRALGLPTDAVAASRAVLTGTVRRLDVLVDDADGVVLGSLGIPAPPRPRSLAAPLWWRAKHPARQRLRVEADGRVLADVDRPVAGVSVRAADGLAEVVVRSWTGARAGDVHVRATSVTVSGAAFSYRANAVDSGPTRTRTWTVRPGALRLTVPAQG
ncbi:diacylglycerol kinase family protein [Streptomyces hoynatensis]|uniref:Diacylglycerol kinase n=1 Tax=Streptomyces hoynatensis TaxID=1141874 RepID=A0A3A9YU39_9ACTN|nr:diacylglycerol kinase family protein [Streptomyces hoynatensis]RKN39553.1 diacylglycerol kinase [Streptomyces hoynatensis]